jgi:antitoxin Phd
MNDRKAVAMNWNVEDAQRKLAEILNEAAANGPQVIEHIGRSFVISLDDSAAPSRKNKDLKDWILNGPSLEGVDLTRDPTPMREVEL